MKKLAVLIGTYLLFSLALGNAQTTKDIANKIINKTLKHEEKIEKRTLRKLKRTDANDISALSFKTDFGNNPDEVWTRTSYFKEASVANEARNKAASDDFEGQLVGKNIIKTSNDISINDQKYLAQNYSALAIGMALNIEANDIDQLSYSSQSKKADNHLFELANGDKKKILPVNPVGEITFYKQMK
jgi:hypothetical protein